MNRFSLKCAMILATTLALGTTAHGGVLFSWENDAQGWEGIDGFTQDPDGVTHGEYAAVVNVVEWTNIQSEWFDDTPELLIGNDTLLVDLRIADIPEQSWQDVNAWLRLEGNIDGQWFGVDGEAQRLQSGTLSFEYGDQLPEIVAGDAQVRFHIRMDTAGGWEGGDVYLDNFRAIPEPTSLGLVALGAMGLLMRRRR